MDVSTIAFLILLGGTPAEHIIVMPSMDDCHRAGESVSQYTCLNSAQFDARLQKAGNIATDLQPAGGPSGLTTLKTEPNAMEGVPSALKRQATKALNPEPARLSPYPSARGNSNGSTSSLDKAGVARLVAFSR